ncbi:AP-2 complex subunit mu-like [Gossypium australe]|uniref:AP-2 complex subunit mu-like n=1 Tax=Gossypium australe TaxID=47621 RepID=A0A5B6UF21_9ROSI|nr:AP-2 complex subunit mu-like [Gossypium australe]
MFSICYINIKNLVAGFSSHPKVDEPKALLVLQHYATIHNSDLGCTHLVPMFTASGLRVRFLKVWEKSGYNTVEWVRYITKAGSYEIRC